MKKTALSLIGVALLLLSGCATYGPPGAIYTEGAIYTDYGHVGVRYEAPITTRVDYVAGYYGDYPRGHERVRWEAPITTRVFDYAAGYREDYPRGHARVRYEAPITTRVFDYAAGRRRY